MKESELRKKIIRYNEMLSFLKSIKTMTAKERENQTKEILALKKYIEEMKEDLYDRENKKQFNSKK